MVYGQRVRPTVLTGEAVGINDWSHLGQLVLDAARQAMAMHLTSRCTAEDDDQLVGLASVRRTDRQQ